jgi:CRISPR-associated protein (TIGR02584 family)
MTRRTKKAVSPQPRAEREIVLVTTIGTSPSVLTSTIWALAEQQRLLPHRIKVLTTRLGRQRLIEKVFTPSPDFDGRTAWESLCESLEAGGFDLRGRLEFAPSPAFLRVFTAIAASERIARELDDITSQSENEQVADAMLEMLRSVTNDDTQIIASIAGGRKTVSALFYACMSLIGRSSDRIIHVVVNEPFDCPDLQPAFIFPAQPKAKLKSRDGRSFCVRDAKLSIVEVPFVPLANLFPKELGRTPGRFSALVAQYREAGQRHVLDGLELVIHRSRREIAVNGQVVSLGPREQALLIFLAEQLHSKKPPFEKWRMALESLRDCLSRIASEAPLGDPSDWRRMLVEGWCTSFRNIEKTEAADEAIAEIRRIVSSLGNKLRTARGSAASLAVALPEKGRICLALRAQQVRFEK